MIRTHDANSRWWGSPVGIVTDPGFFDLEETARAALLAPYAWAEFKSPLAASPEPQVLQRAGFAWVDVQIDFRIALRSVSDSPSLHGYECVSAAERPFTVAAGDIRAFEHERFLSLPGATLDLLNERYATWANQLVAINPEWCLRISRGGSTHGWFFAEADGSTVALTLTMLAAGAAVSGHHLYQRCLRAYAERGGVVGHAAFSVRNTPVLNIYSSLGARFTTTTGVWMWISPSSHDTSA